MEPAVATKLGVWPGILASLAVAAAALLLGMQVPLVGGAVFAILLGVLVANALRLSPTLKPGLAFCSRKVLQFAIVVLGGGLSLTQVWHTGRESAVVMLGTLLMALLMAWGLGRLLRIPTNLAALVGVGTGICGGSAIAAVAPIVEAEDDEIAFAISTVFLFNLLAVVIFPLFGALMRMTDNGFGIWAGTAINDTSSVVAAGYSYSFAAGTTATIVKLARTTMIVPVALGFAFWRTRACRGSSMQVGLCRIFPWFVLGFLGAAVLNTVGAFGTALPQHLSDAGRVLICVALAGVGLGTNLRNLVKTGARPVLLGLLIWAGVACTSLGLQWILRQF
ncbi:MAG: YeiH family putative sulfate export transporter [candidate division WS1 bacterium]|nr:YeiH family putative sulfate export transporter [candidate division WS1 bacterium]